jgi:hypothetical protein
VPTAAYNPITYAVLIGLETIAQRHQYLDGQIGYLTAAITAVVATTNPSLLAAHGVGPEKRSLIRRAVWYRPVPASSGKITRHRLSRGGDRGANNALHHIAVVRMSSHRPTRAYVALQRATRRSTPEILRMLKRAIAREMFKYLTRRVTVPAIDDSAPPDKPKTSPSPGPRHTSASGPPCWPESRTEPNETTPSPPHTDTGSTPLDTNRSVNQSSTRRTSGAAYSTVSISATAASSSRPRSASSGLTAPRARSTGGPCSGPGRTPAFIARPCRRISRSGFGHQTSGGAKPKRPAIGTHLVTCP